MNEIVWTKRARDPMLPVMMSSGWHRRLSLALLLLALGGLVQPAIAVPLASESCCPEVAGLAAAEPEQADARCQWITPTPCCDETAATGAPPGFAPAPAIMCFRNVGHPSAVQHRMPAPAAVPTRQAAALATVVLRL